MMIPSTTRRAALAILGLALAPLAACAPTSSAHGLTVVATTTQICDYVTQIAAASTDLSLDKTDASGKSSHVGVPPHNPAMPRPPSPLRARKRAPRSRCRLIPPQ